MKYGPIQSNFYVKYIVQALGAHRTSALILLFVSFAPAVANVQG